MPATSRAIQRMNARIKAELNEQAHGARMAEFEHLFYHLINGISDTKISPVEITQRKAELFGYVQTMSRRIKLR